MGRHEPHLDHAVKGCKCDGCEDYRAYRREYHARTKVKTGRSRYRAVNAKLERAEAMLKDGASYAETATTISMNPDTVKRYLPGYERNAVEFNSVMSWVKNPNYPERLRLHREIWQGAQYV